MKNGGTLSPSNACVLGVTSDVIPVAVSLWSQLFKQKYYFLISVKQSRQVHCGVITVSFPWLQLLAFWLCTLEEHLYCFTLAWLWSARWSAASSQRAGLLCCLWRMMYAYLHTDANAGVSLLFWKEKKGTYTNSSRLLQNWCWCCCSWRGIWSYLA